MERPPDLTTHKPTDIWILKEGEQPPGGAALTIIRGVRMAFRPRRDEDAEPPRIQ